jgi:hypothetical protein
MAAVEGAARAVSGRKGREGRGAKMTGAHPIAFDALTGLWQA